MRLIAAWVLFACGCGRWGFADPPSNNPDARGDDDASIDSDASIDGATGGPCVWGPWSQARIITSGFSFLAYDPTERTDRLELFITGGPAGTYDILSATRASVADPYTNPTLIPGLNSNTTDDANASITGDGLTLFFTSDRGGQRNAWYATRTTISSAWSAPALVPGIESVTMDSLDVTPNGLALYISRTNVDLTVARRATQSDAFAAPVLVNFEAIPYMSISADELEIYASAGVGITHRSRASIDDPFGPEDVLDVMEAAGDPEITVDGRHLLMSGPGTTEESERTCQ